MRGRLPWGHCHKPDRARFLVEGFLTRAIDQNHFQRRRRQYMRIRNIYLFVAATEKGVEYPGSQAGIADMISAAQDEHRWIIGFWH